MRKYSVRAFLAVIPFRINRLSFNIVTVLLVALCAGVLGCDIDSGTGPQPTPTPQPSPTPSPTPTPGPTPTPTPTPTPPPADTLSAVQIAMGEEPVSCDDPIWDEGDEISVNTGSVRTQALYGNGQLNMTGTFAGAADFNGGETANLRLTALYTTGSGQVFIRARWDDMIFNLDRRRALFNGPADPLKADDPAGYTSQLNDDKIGLAFQIVPGTSSEFGTFDEVGCFASCHNVAGEGLDMRPETGKVDIWHWKTQRSEPLGFVNDQVSDLVNGRTNDSGTPIEVRNLAVGGNNRSGPKFIWDGTDQTIPSGPRAGEVLDSAFTLLINHLLDVTAEGRDADNGEVIFQANCAVCHGANGGGGIGPALNTIEFGRVSDAELDADIADVAHPGAGAYVALSDADQADLRLRVFGFWGTQGYFLQLPDGSNADITTLSDLDYTQSGIDSLTNITEPQQEDPPGGELNKYKFQQDGYCLVITRDLDTTHDDDVLFEPGQSYPFGVALMDNDGINHIGNTLLTLEFLLP